MPYTIWTGLTYVLSALITVPVYFILSFIGGEKLEQRIATYNRNWSKIWGSICGIRVKVIDRHKVDKNQSYIFACNHTSNLDTMIFPRSSIFALRPLAKKEIKKIPVMGYLFDKAGIFVDRSSAESRSESMKAMKNLIDRGVSVFIFPEGTRNRTDKPLGPFYNGAFRLAIESGIPIVPVVMTNVRRMMSEKTIWMKPGKATVIYHDPISTEGYTMDDVEKLRDKVYQVMEESVIKHSLKSF